MTERMNEQTNEQTNEQRTEHPEWAKVNSLTAPADRGDGKFKADTRAPVLTDPELDAALLTQNNTSFVDKFPRVERQFADPPIPLQMFSLVSFVPARGATPDKDGVFGFMKARGNYATTQEANERAEYLLRNVDSYHQIFQKISLWIVHRLYQLQIFFPQPRYSLLAELIFLQRSVRYVFPAQILICLKFDFYLYMIPILFVELL